jgi:hypothetical protein
MLRWCAMPAALILLAGAARADEAGSGRVSGARTSQELPRWPLASLASAARAEAPDSKAAPDNEVTAPDLSAEAPLDLSTPEPDAVKPFTPRASGPASVAEWSSRMGVDYRKPSIPATDFQPAPLTAGAIPDQSTGVAWATVTGSGFDLPLGWDKASIETRLDPAQEQGQFGTTLSRSVPVGENVTVTLENGVSVTRPLANTAHGNGWASSQALRFNLLPTDTSFSVGANISSTDEKWLPSLSAEQKLFGTPLSVTGSVSESASGETSKSLKAGFKHQW